MVTFDEFEDAILEKVDIERKIKKLISKLTVQEFKVLYFLSMGYNIAEVGRLIGISRGWTREIRKRIYRKYLALDCEPSPPEQDDMQT